MNPARFEQKDTKYKPRRRGLDALPVYYTIPEAAKLLKRSTESARRWLTHAGLVIHRGGRPCVATAQLLAEFPEVTQRLLLDD
jgi:hypothetical protein